MLKYQTIANEIENYIETHQLQHGEKLPVLDQLMTQFNTSKTTIIKALDSLEKQGIVFQVRGSGIFVRRKKRADYISLLSNQGFKQELEQFNITSDIIEFNIQKPTHKIAQNLHISLDQDIYYVKRVRHMDGKPFCIESSYYNKAYVTYLNNEIIQNSIFSYIQEGLGLKIGFSDFYMQMDKLTAFEATHLHLQENDPKLIVEQLFYLTNGVPFNYSEIHYHYQYAKFYVFSTNH
ncbi:GntR family transcriptional regulator [Staphylococcus sp. 17KM0847]|uniref:GntR family transcriptional regulator n=1 Tax=Staphylococcus sp. 17KM0847 TaxID=2583989 RepID=UPI0015DD2351|nr:GntR family transcriptional regulator [Staphylococcus sp. 17KM0847]QLK86577.1 GntR family transcriptional regulator [Staphylococcus sp. 17KM0847]